MRLIENKLTLADYAFIVLLILILLTILENLRKRKSITNIVYNALVLVLFIFLSIWLKNMWLVLFALLFCNYSKEPKNE